MRIFFLIGLIFILGIASDVCASGVVAKQQQMQQEQLQNQSQQSPQQRSTQQPNQPQYNSQESYKNSQIKNYESLQRQQIDVIDIVQIWRELDFSSEIWPLIIDQEPKEITIREYIKLYHEKGIYIRKTPSSYVGLIDEMLVNRPELLSSPFKNVLRFAAIMEYDFDNGKDPDHMALQLLGQAVYEENKRRLGR